MRLPTDPRLPSSPDTAYAKDLNRQLAPILREIANKVNALADGTLAAIDNARTTAPTTGTWAQGDFVRNSAPVELGVASSKYVVLGWINVAGGTPGTFVQCRFLTGN